MTAQEITHEYLLIGTDEKPFECDDILEARKALKMYNQTHHKPAKLARRIVTHWKVIEDGVLSTQSS